jgi:hypothetical protein
MDFAGKFFHSHLVVTEERLIISLFLATSLVNTQCDGRFFESVHAFAINSAYRTIKPIN